MANTLILPGLDRARWRLVIDCLAVGVAVWLPWSTSLTEIFVTLWLIAFLPTLFVPRLDENPDIGVLRRVLATPAGYLPVLLCILAALGMVWATDVSLAERLGGFSKFPRLIVIPLLLTHFQRSERGAWVFGGFLLASLALLVVSYGLALLPGLSWRGAKAETGVPVNDYIRQSSLFLLCAFALLGRAIDDAKAQRWKWVPALGVGAGLFLGNIFFVVTSRTALVVAPLLFLLLGWREFRWKGLVGAVVLGAVAAAAIWASSPYMRERLLTSVGEWRAYRASNAPNSTGLRAEFLRKSLSFVESAPIIGHGTGSIPQQFRNAVIGQGGASAAAPENPHNQFLAIAIQLGAVGAIVLAAMWIAHLMLFTGAGFTAWVGLAVVAENILSSLFNSHLFDTCEGWLYIFGVGVAGGMVLRLRETKSPPA
jgi:O-antigen ligase